ncbi:GNAT family N-acetyltransferase [Aquibacillus halophilus]|uniref:GNAT family N-acetyltransferase n=1 Tax=Aquibacillus halophilus TaxID=930132 RepID=A0A6A8D8I8_9BACI|nr:GNAT family N-acetyltransferase [Aquibacillus halophilus]
MNEIKVITKEEYYHVLSLGEYAFNYRLTEQDRQDRSKMMENQIILGSYDKSGTLASKLHLLPMELFLGSKVIPFGGIAGVATWPEHRRKGHVQRLMRMALMEMKKHPLPLSMLHPFSVGFYRNYGWELTQHIHKYFFKPTDLRVKRVNGHTQRVLYSEQKDTLQFLYEQHAITYCLMLKREQWWWEKRVISKDDQIVIYFDSSNIPQGYLISKIVDKRLKVEEFIYQNGEACYGLLQWIRNHDSMLNEVEMVIQPQDQISFYFDNPKITMKKDAYFMTRIVDFQSFVKEYPFFKSVDQLFLRIDLIDDLAEWNNGSWLLKIENNVVSNVELNLAFRSDFTITTDIQTLTALLFGSEPIDRLISFDLLKVEGNINLLKKIIQPMQPALLDFF